MTSVRDLIDDIKREGAFKDVVHHEVIPARPARYAPWPAGISDEIIKGLGGKGLERPYIHQALGIEAILGGRNIVIMTPTASGKSLIYQVPIMQAILDDPMATALYISPLKGLLHDQKRSFTEVFEGIISGKDEARPLTSRARSIGHVEIYDGDTTAYRKKKIRESPPRVVLTNPDMIHLSMNAYHEQWAGFLSSLRYVVMDEIHTYRGVFGSHVANVMRRLRRVLLRHNASPQFIACTATVANPLEHAAMLTGLDFDLIDDSGAPSGKRNFVFINPEPGQSPYTLSTRLFTRAVSMGLRTIAFTRARKITELLHSWVVRVNPELGAKVSAYRAGFLPEERREIEKKLFSGLLQGVITTSALELGVDIGGLDICLLVGYPGSVSSTWQRGGRAGRTGRESLIVLIALEDSLDQYFMRSPGEFFQSPVEAAVLDMENPVILKPHLLCSASETYLRSTDPVYDVPSYKGLPHELQAEGKVRYWEKGDIWYPRKRFPQREVSIRATGAVYRIITTGGSLIGESSSKRVFHDLHPGALYLHGGASYRVVRLDTGERTVTVVPADDANYHTVALTSEETEIISIDEKKRIGTLLLHYGTLRVRELVRGYMKKELYTERTLGEFSLDLPPTVFTTKGVWMEVDEDVLEEARTLGYSPDGSLHALEHAAIAALPLYALCDRMDLGGISYPLNRELGSPAIFIYDGHEGGVGLTRRGFYFVREWFGSTLRLMDECPCEISCPSCTQDPWCGNGNEPLDKRGAVLILRRWLIRG